MSASSLSSGSPVASRRQREKEGRRKTILDAAERVFARHGFHAATMDKIAREAEYSPGTLYLYFKDKDALYFALFVSKLTEMVDTAERAGNACSDPLDGLHKLTVAHFEYSDRNREFSEVFFKHHPGEQPEQSEGGRTIERVIERHHAVVRRLVEEAQRRGQIDAGDPQAYASALIGMILHMSREMERQRRPLGQEAEFVFALFLNGARHLSATP